MQFKKSIFLASLMGLSISAYAGLQTFNYTDEDSAVKVTSGTVHPCSGSGGVYTPRRNADGTPGTSTAKDNEIKLLCLTSKNNVCTAQIYADKYCNGTPIGNASLDLTKNVVTSVISTNPRYVFENGGTVLKVRYAS